MYEEQVINLTSNEMKQFDWTTSVAHKCGPKKLDQRGEMKNDNNEFWLDVREYSHVTFLGPHL